MIALVDYGLGNIQAFANIYRRLGIDSVTATKPAELEQADKIILPGVGAFDWAMKRLEESGLRNALDHEVLSCEKPVLGVCVGMQMMAKSSDEGSLSGLGWIDARVVKFDNCNRDIRLPHMGWNDVVPTHHETLFHNIEDPRFYFLHSYYFQPSNPSVVLAQADYGHTYTSAVSERNIYGTQFHPEKSHHWGVQLLKNFAELA